MRFRRNKELVHSKGTFFKNFVLLMFLKNNILLPSSKLLKKEFHKLKLRKTFCLGNLNFNKIFICLNSGNLF